MNVGRCGGLRWWGGWGSRVNEVEGKQVEEEGHEVMEMRDCAVEVVIGDGGRRLREMVRTGTTVERWLPRGRAHEGLSR